MHKLDEIAEKVKACQNCKLCETRTKAVPGKGRFDADVIFVGEAPGRNEDIHGEPFVGAAGKRLDMICLLYTSSLLIPVSSKIISSRFPAAPTNGSP